MIPIPIVLLIVVLISFGVIGGAGEIGENQEAWAQSSDVQTGWLTDTQADERTDGQTEGRRKHR